MDERLLLLLRALWPVLGRYDIPTDTSLEIHLEVFNLEGGLQDGKLSLSDSAYFIVEDNEVRIGPALQFRCGPYDPIVDDPEILWSWAEYNGRLLTSKDIGPDYELRITEPVWRRIEWFVRRVVEHAEANEDKFHRYSVHYRWTDHLPHVRYEDEIGDGPKEYFEDIPDDIATPAAVWLIPLKAEEDGHGA